MDSEKGRDSGLQSLKMTREKDISTAGWLGILLNLFLGILKTVEGILVKSSSLFTDGVNNFADMLTSAVTVIGIHYSYKKPDASHPMGYGRAEYLSSMVICLTVAAAGGYSLISGIQTILYGKHPSYTTTSFVILIVSAVSKILLGLYDKKVGKRASSNSLTASGTKAYDSAWLSLLTLAGAILSRIFNLETVHPWIDGIITLILAAFILRSGLQGLSRTISQLLGPSPEPELEVRIRKQVQSHPEILETGELIIDNYGPKRQIGYLRVKVDGKMGADEFDALSRRIETEIFEAFNIPMALGLYTDRKQNPGDAGPSEDPGSAGK